MIRELERVVLLKVIDNKWMSHIDDMEQLRQGIGLQAYGQRDPLVEYKMSGYEMFNSMTESIQEDTLRLLFHIRVEQKVEREQVAKVTGTNKDDSKAKTPVKKAAAKVYPNDPCPCGSGKKYKNLLRQEQIRQAGDFNRKQGNSAGWRADRQPARPPADFFQKEKV